MGNLFIRYLYLIGKRHMLTPLIFDILSSINFPLGFPKELKSRALEHNTLILLVFCNISEILWIYNSDPEIAGKYLCTT